MLDELHCRLLPNLAVRLSVVSHAPCSQWSVLRHCGTIGVSNDILNDCHQQYLLEKRCDATWCGTRRYG